MFGWKVPLAKASIREEDVAAVTAVLRSGIVSNGPMTAQFEEMFAAYVGAKHAVAMNSGTSALHACLVAMGIGPGDEVITSPFSFIASANCIEMAGAKPVFVDIDPISLNLDPRKIASACTERTKALLPVHIFGLSAEAALLCGEAETYGLAVLEDACEALGAAVGGRRVGSCLTDGGESRAACFGFYANKQLTTGEGGMATTNDADFAVLCRSLRNQGRGEQGGWLDHVRVGYNYRIDEMSAALGMSQLARLDETLERRTQVAEHYRGRLRGLKDRLILPVEVAGYTRSWFVFPIVARQGISREKLIEALQEKGIQCGRYFSPPIHLQPCYREKYGYEPGAFPIAEGIANQIFATPFYTDMTPDEVDFVCDALETAVKAC